MAPGHGQPASTIEESLRVPMDALPPRVATSFNAFNIYGLPTIAIPCGFTSKGLPLGLQMSGPQFGEEKLFALAHAFQQKTAWHTRVPLL